MFDRVKWIDKLVHWLRKPKIILNDFDRWRNFAYVSLCHFMKNFSSFILL